MRVLYSEKKSVTTIRSAKPTANRMTNHPVGEIRFVKDKEFVGTLIDSRACTTVASIYENAGKKARAFDSMNQRLCKVNSW
jgi:prolyl-tRNA editing enzyme YbaK/EbsC (Cys-tRNA(Pro) deacylase)